MIALVITLVAAGGIGVGMLIGYHIGKKDGAEEEAKKYMEPWELHQEEKIRVSRLGEE